MILPYMVRGERSEEGNNVQHYMILGIIIALALRSINVTLMSEKKKERGERGESKERARRGERRKKRKERYERREI